MLAEMWQRFIDFLCLFFMEDNWTRYPVFLWGKWYTSDERMFSKYKDAIVWEKSHNNIHYRGLSLNKDTGLYEWFEDYYE